MVHHSQLAKRARAPWLPAKFAQRSVKTTNPAYERIHSAGDVVSYERSIGVRGRQISFC